MKNNFFVIEITTNNLECTREDKRNKIQTTNCTAIDESRWLCENCKRLTENDKKDNGVMRLTEGFDYYAHGNENTIKI